MENIELQNELYGSHLWGDIKEVFISDFKRCRSNNDLIKLHNKYIPYIWYDRAYNTILKKYADIRNLIKEIDNKHSKFALEHIFNMAINKVNNKPFSKGIYDITRKKNDKKQADKRSGDLVEIDLKKVEKLMKELKRKIDTDDYGVIGNNQKKEMVKAYHISILLALATGRRQVEILKTLEIDYSKNRKQQIYFKGIVKQGYKNPNVRQKGNIIYLSVKETKDYLKELRKIINVKDLDNRAINQKYNGILSNALIKYTKDIIGTKLKFHDLRSLYAEYSWETQSEGFINKSLFFQLVLNHSPKIDVTAHYFNFKTIKESKEIKEK